MSKMKNISKEKIEKDLIDVASDRSPGYYVEGIFVCHFLGCHVCTYNNIKEDKCDLLDHSILEIMHSKNRKELVIRLAKSRIKMRLEDAN